MKAGWVPRPASHSCVAGPWRDEPLVMVSRRRPSPQLRAGAIRHSVTEHYAMTRDDEKVVGNCINPCELFRKTFRNKSTRYCPRNDIARRYLPNCRCLFRWRAADGRHQPARPLPSYLRKVRAASLCMCAPGWEDGSLAWLQVASCPIESGPYWTRSPPGTRSAGERLSRLSSPGGPALDSRPHGQQGLHRPAGALRPEAVTCLLSYYCSDGVPSTCIPYSRLAFRTIA